MGCWAMVEDYVDDSSSKENLNFLLCLTGVEASIDLKRQGQRFLKGIFKKTRMSGASTTTPGNSRLHRELKARSAKGAHTQK